MVWRYCPHCTEPLTLPDWDAPQCRLCQALVCCDACLTDHLAEEHPRTDATPEQDAPHPGYPAAGYTRVLR